MSARHHSHGVLPLHSTDDTAGLGITLAATPVKSGTITTAITHEVTLGGHYPRHLTIAATGSISPTASGATALYDPSTLNGARILNLGSITGGAGTTSNGGVGVDLAGNKSVLTNNGTITGGYGARNYAGGAGVAVGTGAALMNNGTIDGGGSFYQNGVDNYLPGGVGVLLEAGASLTNEGIILGGSAYLDTAGVQVDGAGARITNFGTIAGNGAHATPAEGGDGILINATASVVNYGSILGRYEYPPNGGDGIAASAAITLVNHGLIRGYGAVDNDLSQGIGVDVMQGGTITNVGTILGGQGVYYENGGAGLYFRGSGSILNTGYIRGGGGGPDGQGRYTGWANAVTLDGACTLTNSGTLITGAPLEGAAPASVGVAVSGGATVINTGSIQGAAGVYLDGGTLVNAGTVSGWRERHQPYGIAVTFGAQASTLVVEEGAVFNGFVFADASAQDTLTLGAATAGTLSGFGTEFTNFASLTEIAGATWTLTNTAPVAATTTLDITGNLTIAGNFSDAGLLTNTGTITGTTGTLSFLGTITNNGTFDTGSGLLAITPLVEGTGNLDINAGGTLNLGNGAIATETIDFLANTGLAVLQHPFSFVGSIEGFATGDKIDLTKPTGFMENGSSWANNTLTLTENGATVATLHFDGTYNPNDFSLVSDGDKGILLTYT